jgi:hypothetical protein
VDITHIIIKYTQCDEKRGSIGFNSADRRIVGSYDLALRSLLNRFTEHAVLPLLLNRGGGGVSIDVVIGG